MSHKFEGEGQRRAPVRCIVKLARPAHEEAHAVFHCARVGSQ